MHRADDPEQHSERDVPPERLREGVHVVRSDPSPLPRVADQDGDQVQGERGLQGHQPSQVLSRLQVREAEAKNIKLVGG